MAANLIIIVARRVVHERISFPRSVRSTVYIFVFFFSLFSSPRILLLLLLFISAHSKWNRDIIKIIIIIILWLSLIGTSGGGGRHARRIRPRTATAICNLSFFVRARARKKKTKYKNMPPALLRLSWFMYFSLLQWQFCASSLNTTFFWKF